MALLQEWQKIAYNEQADRAKLQKFWQDYFLVEKGIYEKLLDHPDEEATDPEEGIKTILNFSYYDTTPLPNGSYSTKKLILSLTDKPLTIVKDHYTVTNIRLRNNRIIDLSVSGDFGIDWKWD